MDAGTERERERSARGVKQLLLTLTPSPLTTRLLNYCCSFEDRQQPEQLLPATPFKKKTSGTQVSQPTSDLNKACDVYSCASGFTRYQMIRETTTRFLSLACDVWIMHYTCWATVCTAEEAAQCLTYRHYRTDQLRRASQTLDKDFFIYSVNHLPSVTSGKYFIGKWFFSEYISGTRQINVLSKSLPETVDFPSVWSTRQSLENIRQKLDEL